jgi:precorrin-6A/cobalt-precorrin-6A reductase
LLLGGTADATRLARLLAEAGLDAIFSYAGRTESPTPQPLPVRIGGFGGVDGLAEFLDTEKITHLIDATHPFAAGMSRNAVAAAARTRTRLIALERAPWQARPGDRWQEVADIAGAVAALPAEPARVFLAIGRQNIAAFAARPEHFYLLRFIDAPESITLPHHVALRMRGPFTEAGDRALLEHHAITHLVAKNAGGEATRAKIDAARALGLPVIMIRRPEIPERPCLETAEAVMAHLAHEADLGV